MATILIVDDNKKNLQVLGNILHEQKYKVAMAIDGVSALNLAKKINPDLIVLDIMMPGMDGFEVCSILKKQEETKAIPVIFLTAKVDLDDLVKGFSLGGADYVTKPFKKDELLARVATQIELINGRNKILKQSKELSELNGLNNKLFEVMASDLKHALDNFTEIPKLLTNPRLTLSKDEINDILNELESKATGTSELLENVLTWSKLQQKTIFPKISRVKIKPLLNALVKSFATKSDKKEIKINLQINDNDEVIADKILLTIVIKNVLDNAIKYSFPKTEIDIYFKSQAAQSSLTIADHGVGIDEDAMALIHSPFSYYVSYGTRNEKGSGIGLKVVAEIMHLLNLTLHIESEKEKGTKVELNFQNHLIN